MNKKTEGDVQMNKKEQEWANEVAERIAEKVNRTAARNANKIPYTTVNGVFDDWSDRIGWWTNGFWGGQLWQLFHAFGKEELRRIAENIEQRSMQLSVSCRQWRVWEVCPLSARIRQER